jgi:hypothetical protein
MRVRSWVGLITVLVAGAYTGHARAYSDVGRFGEPSGAGGGGGRQFTGSPVDGYGCNVCHQGGVEPKVQVLGLPEGYTPGRLYEIEVIWNPDPAVPHALQLEFVGRDGLAAGKVLLLDKSQLDAAQFCDRKTDQPVADYENSVGGRKILGVQNCGASHMRFRFGPPDTPDVSFALSLVSSDKSGSADGDGVFNMKRVLRRAGEPAPSQGCAIVAPSADAGALPAALSFLLLALWLVRRRAVGSAG